VRKYRAVGGKVMKITVVGAIAVLAAIVAVVLLLHYLDRKQAS